MRKRRGSGRVVTARGGTSGGLGERRRLPEGCWAVTAQRLGARPPSAAWQPGRAGAPPGAETSCMALNRATLERGGEGE